jgi:hypothetical protein
MRTVESLVPAGSPTVDDVVARAISTAHSEVKPFDTRVVDALDDLSAHLFRRQRLTGASELAPLAFFIRRAAIARLVDRVEARLPEGTVAVPAGVVFHVPPANVDTLFVYTLALSLVAGNSNIVRISERTGPAGLGIVEDLGTVISDHPEVSPLVHVVRYGRDDEITGSFSRSCDVRMLWGGDASVNALRRVPIPPHARDVTFPDRTSLTAIDAVRYLNSTEAERIRVAEALYNDSYWFDQMACSSPQQVVFIGPADGCEAAERLLVEALGRQAALHGYEVPAAIAVSKMVAAVRGAAAGATRIRWMSDSTVVLDDLDFRKVTEIRPGAGFFSARHVRRLADIADSIDRRTQTLATFGVGFGDLQDLLSVLNGRGIDRVVRVGQALAFGAVWDGKDLLRELMRLVTIDVD